MNRKLLIPLLLLSACTAGRRITGIEKNHFPVSREKAVKLPPKEKFYIFLLAGQSNMAGRGFVQPADTISHKRVLALDSNNEWVYAKEPLHYYEPSRTGLDCGLAFGKKLEALYGKDITIGIVPCAVGGSSVEQWLGDSTYRTVKLYTNLLEKANSAAQAGTIKGLLWHQGESNATASGYRNFRQKLGIFFTKVRSDLNHANLPVYTAQLASFLRAGEFPNAALVNNDLQAISTTFNNIYVVETGDLKSLKDSIHFNSPSQREMGKRFAKKVYRSTSR